MKHSVHAVVLCPSIHLSVYVSVCPSVTSQCSTKMAKCRITETMLYTIAQGL